jgi:EmrB/QacA subfamily drug resistance transporter
VLITLSLGFFMTLLDLTIVNIAIPNMVDKLGASLDQVLWISNAYTLVLAVTLITAGRLGDLRGKKSLFLAGVVVFTMASLACGLAQNPAQLIAARAVQGFGAALMLPQTLSIIVDIFPAERRGAALGIRGSVAGLSTVAGPTVGGLLVTEFSWRWIFFVNLPIGILVLLAAIPILPGGRRVPGQRLDVRGVVLATASLFCIAFALTEGPRYGWDGRVWAFVAAGVVLLAALLVQQRRQQERQPLIPFSLFGDRNFTLMNVVAVCVSFGVMGLFLTMTIYLQSVLGFSALKAGLVMAPTSVAAMLVAGPVGKLVDKFGGKYILMTGLVLYAAGTLWLAAAAGVGRSWTAVLPAFILAGIGFGCTFTPMTTEAMRNVPPRLSGAASGVSNTIRQVGSVLAGAAVGAILQNQLAAALREQARQRAAEVPAPYRDHFVQGFADAGKHGLEVGTGQVATAGSPAGLPQDVADRIHGVATQVFEHGFVSAMRPAMIVPVLVVLLGALACLPVRVSRPGGPARQGQGQVESAPATPTADAAIG